LEKKEIAGRVHPCICNLLKRAFVCFLVVAAALRPFPVRADDVALDIDAAASTVTFTLGAFLHTVHGSFKMKSGTLHFDPASRKAGGEIAVDLTTGSSGLGARDAVMHGQVLESGRYPSAVFTSDAVTGRLKPNGESTLDIHGRLAIHGGAHEWTFRTTISTKGAQLAATTHTSIPYVQWGMKNPSTFLLRVDDHVEVDVRAIAHIRSTPL